jgi:hypothetical protein
MTKRRVEIPLTPAQAEKLRASGLIRGLKSIQKRIGEATEPAVGDLASTELSDTAAIATKKQRGMKRKVSQVAIRAERRRREREGLDASRGALAQFFGCSKRTISRYW